MLIKGNIFTYNYDETGRVIFDDKDQFKIFCESIIKAERRRTIKIFESQTPQPFGQPMVDEMINQITEDEIFG